MSEYDHKKSTKVVGQLYPVIIDKAGNVIDGLHRQEADPNWRTEVHPEIDSQEKFLIARCVANWHRRQVPKEEKEEWINGLARIYKKQGCQIPQLTGQRNEVVEKIVNVTGLAESTVRAYLKDEFKVQKAYKKGTKPRVPASQAIISKVGEGYGKRLVERHREEVKEDLKTDVDFMAETVKEHPEVVSKAIKQVSLIPEPVYAPPEEIQKARGRAEEIEEEKRKLDLDPKVQEKRKLFQNFSSLQQIAMFASEAKCPVCGADHSNLVWKCHNLTPEEALDKAHKKVEDFK